MELTASKQITYHHYIQDYILKNQEESFLFLYPSEIDIHLHNENLKLTQKQQDGKVIYFIPDVEIFVDSNNQNIEVEKLISDDTIQYLLFVNFKNIKSKKIQSISGDHIKKIVYSTLNQDYTTLVLKEDYKVIQIKEYAYTIEEINDRLQHLRLDVSPSFISKLSKALSFYATYQIKFLLDYIFYENKLPLFLEMLLDSNQRDDVIEKVLYKVLFNNDKHYCIDLVTRFSQCSFNDFIQKDSINISNNEVLKFIEQIPFYKSLFSIINKDDNYIILLNNKEVFKYSDEIQIITKQYQKCNDMARTILRNYNEIHQQKIDSKLFKEIKQFIESDVYQASIKCFFPKEWFVLEEHYYLEVKKQEAYNKADKRVEKKSLWLRRFLFFTGIIVLFYSIGLLVFSFQKSLIAEKEKLNAIEALSIAEEQTQIAQNQKNIANKEKENAFKAQKTAEKATQIAKIQKQNALVAKKNTEKAYQEVIIQKEMANAALLVAKEEQRKTLKANRENERLQNLSTSKALAFAAHNVTDDTISLSLALHAVKGYLNNGGENQDASYYSTLLKSLERNEGKHYNVIGHQENSIRKLLQVDNDVLMIDGVGNVFSLINDEKLFALNQIINEAKFIQGNIVLIDHRGNLSVYDKDFNMIANDFDKIKFIPLIIEGDHQIFLSDENSTIYSFDFKQLNKLGSIDGFGKVTDMLSYDKFLLVSTDKGSLIKYSDSLQVITKFSTSISCLNRINNYLLIGFENGAIQSFDPNDNYSFIKEFHQHGSRIKELIAINNEMFISLSFDGTCKIWALDKAQNDPIALVGHNHWVLTATILEDKLLTAAMNGEIRTWELHLKNLLNTVSENKVEALSHEQWNRYVGEEYDFHSTFNLQ
ncbi:hypothetical protein [Flammeovirga pacifica]|uniref:Uncharacterized protein n=1 Tax=Flammeovirga pacifica TaxID=915059 RepID=A0A1S1YXD9_FLAPC|nr:hypothetical protein [Flammeovirga pacifica]OHX65677.1 hypothetical protein NH26_04600 [Flammeovirga pacifica]